MKIMLGKFKLGFFIVIMLILVSCSSMRRPVVPAHATNQQETLSAHNKWRALHNAPDLVWDKKLAAYAGKHASKCQFEHSSSPYGENLASGYLSITAAVNAWYAEEAEYSYNKPGFSHATGHFTQLVWRKSKKLGCSYAACNGKRNTPGIYWVCEYSPAGNVINKGYFAANVLPSK